jgi:hypothetical protein
MTKPEAEKKRASESVLLLTYVQLGSEYQSGYINSETDTCTWSVTADGHPNLCDQPVSSRLNASKCCPLHKCLKVNCHEQARDLGGFCSAFHACNTLNCPERQVSGVKILNAKGYCKTHGCACTNQGCVEKAQGPRYPFCLARHACLQAECDELRVTAKYCTDHNCKHAGCGNNAKDKGGLCTELHVCIYTGCTSFRDEAVAGTMYCRMHKCKDDNCMREVREEAGYYTSHVCKRTSPSPCRNRRSSSTATTRFCTAHEC